MSLYEVRVRTVVHRALRWWRHCRFLSGPRCSGPPDLLPRYRAMSLDVSMLWTKILKRNRYRNTGGSELPPNILTKLRATSSAIRCPLNGRSGDGELKKDIRILSLRYIRHMEAAANLGRVRDADETRNVRVPRPTWRSRRCHLLTSHAHLHRNQPLPALIVITPSQPSIRTCATQRQLPSPG